ncbi:hypothetical protein PCANC_22266 [Puccinia coronata f. sp. avenae]|uniref:Uncharacterized protein n=1 Tax=Puccinia coronata f. sp. avenae TaxID=200324 RepID=A0A2N5UTL3_9BASI|nr:hypothetical protein PCANC_22266 [Puccinia coronata f. sp. avenae]
MQKRSVVKSRDVLFEDGTFPYGEPTENSPAPVMVKLPWPPAGPSSYASEPPSDHVIPDSGLTRVPPVEPANPIAPTTSDPVASIQSPPPPPSAIPPRKSSRIRRSPDCYGFWAKRAAPD